MKKVGYERQPTVAVDFDGVIADYSEGYKGLGIFGKPLPGARESIWTLKQAGWKIIIHTARHEHAMLADYLREHDIPFDEINRNSDAHAPGAGEIKPIADVYLDDRAVNFGGNWTKALADIQDLMRRKGPLAFRKD